MSAWKNIKENQEPQRNNSWIAWIIWILVFQPLSLSRREVFVSHDFHFSWEWVWVLAAVWTQSLCSAPEGMAGVQPSLLREEWDWIERVSEINVNLWSERKTYWFAAGCMGYCKALTYLLLPGILVLVCFRLVL